MTDMNDVAGPASDTGSTSTGPEGAVAGVLLVMCLLGLTFGLVSIARSPEAKLPAPGSTIKAVMNEWSIDTPTHLKAGTYLYDISNIGSMEHEMLVMKTDLPATRLPMKNGNIDEDKLPPVSDGENVAPGHSQTRTIDLSKPGQYLFVCNIPGHFRQGMFTYVTVDPAPGSGRPAAALPAPGSTINAAMSEWKIVTPTVLAPGTYNYNITNVGTMEHEMLVMKTDLAPDQLPMKDGDIDEEKLPPVSDGENVPVGGKQTRKIDLTEPGRYLFVCNIKGHFAHGMFTYVTVQAPAGSGQSAGALPAPGSTVNAAMSEWKILTPTVLARGTYTYNITNLGTMEHEMLVMKTDLAPDQLPMKDGDIDEEKLPPVSDGENVPVGGKQTRKIDLTKPGRYLFVCNIKGHFAHGMFTYVTVK